MRILVVAATLMLGGCACFQTPRPQTNVIHHAKPVVTAPVVVTPNDQVKHRWYDKFKKHPKWFH